MEFFGKMRRAVPSLLVLAVLIAACGDSGATESSGVEATDESVCVEGPGPSRAYTTDGGYDLAGTSWAVYEYMSDEGERTDKLRDTTITLEFCEDGSVSGFAGCNDYQAQYAVSGEFVVTDGSSASEGQQIEITDLTHTDEVCEPAELMEQEAVYFARLEEAHRWWIAIDTHIFLGNGRLLVGARPQ